jgi:hypothetical protein
MEKVRKKWGWWSVLLGAVVRVQCRCTKKEIQVFLMQTLKKKSQKIGAVVEI